MNISAFFALNLGATVSEIIAPSIEDLWFLCIISVNIHKDPRLDAIGVSPIIFPQRVLREGVREGGREDSQKCWGVNILRSN